MNHKPRCPAFEELPNMTIIRDVPCTCPQPYVITEDRPLSWSNVNSFEYDARQWYDNYILGIRQTSPEMTFGSMVDKRLQDDPEYLPHVPRYPLMQHKMRANIGDLPLIGVPDGLDFENRILSDYKTGKKAWDQKRTNDTGQLKFYLLLIYLTEKIRPGEFKCLIHWLPTAYQSDFTIGFRNPNDPELFTFATSHTLPDILHFANYLKDTYALMQRYVKQRQSQG